MGGSFFMAEILPPTGPAAASSTQQAFQVTASIDVDEILSRLVNETRRLLSDLQQQGLTGDALARAVQDGLKSLSDTPIEQAGRGAATEAFNLGRNLAYQEHPEVKEVVRTEVLDENTCEYCAAVDGKVVQMNSPEYFEFMPPNGCHGRDLCRGFYYAAGGA